MIRISFPGGAGGNWLKGTIDIEAIPADGVVNFHKHQRNLNDILLMHEIDINKFDFLYSGSSYFNFYLNVIYKAFYYEQGVFDNLTDSEKYRMAFLKSVDTAKFLCQYAEIEHAIHFDFGDLVNNDQKFHNKIQDLQIGNGCPVLSYKDFAKRKHKFISTCVTPIGIYENFNDPMWVTFVLGQLMNLDVSPVEFSIYDRKNFELSQQFAQDNYHLCQHTQVLMFDTSVVLPKLL